MQAPASEFGNRGKPLAQIALEGLQLRHPGRPRTIDRRLEAAGDDLAHGFAVQPSAPCDRRYADALPMQIKDHDNLSQSDHRLPPISEGQALATNR
jgi:hypothetical protein